MTFPGIFPFINRQKWTPRYTSYSRTKVSTIINMNKNTHQGYSTPVKGGISNETLSFNFFKLWLQSRLLIRSLWTPRNLWKQGRFWAFWRDGRLWFRKNWPESFQLIWECSYATSFSTPDYVPGRKRPTTFNVHISVTPQQKFSQYIWTCHLNPLASDLFSSQRSSIDNLLTSFPLTCG